MLSSSVPPMSTGISLTSSTIELDDKYGRMINEARPKKPCVGYRVGSCSQAICRTQEQRSAERQYMLHDPTPYPARWWRHQREPSSELSEQVCYPLVAA